MRVTFFAVFRQLSVSRYDKLCQSCLRSRISQWSRCGGKLEQQSNIVTMHPDLLFGDCVEKGVQLTLSRALRFKQETCLFALEHRHWGESVVVDIHRASLACDGQPSCSRSSAVSNSRLESNKSLHVGQAQKMAAQRLEQRIEPQLVQNLFRRNALQKPRCNALLLWKHASPCILYQR